MNSSSLFDTIKSYDQHAEGYEPRWPNYLSHTHHRFLSQMVINQDDIILDLSCGTGLLAQYMLDAGYSFKLMILNDIADKMQQQAHKRFEGQNNVRFTHYHAEAIAFPPCRFDKICCLNAFHNYQHQREVIRRCYNALQGGGTLFVLDWNCSGWFRPVNWYIDHIGTENINTKSARQMKRMLCDQGFELCYKKEWYFTYWKFFYIIARK